MTQQIIETQFNQLSVRFDGNYLNIEQDTITSDGSKFNTGRLSLSKEELSALKDYLNQLDIENEFTI